MSIQEELDKAIGQGLKQARKEANITQTELARELVALGFPGFYQTTIMKVETGRRSLKFAEACAIAEVFRERAALRGPAD